MKKIFDIFKIKSQAYFSTNVMFVAFIGINLFNAFLLRALTVGNFFEVKPVIGDLAVLLIIGSLAYFIKPRKQYLYFMVWTILLTTLCIINSSYYSFYMSFASVSLLSTSVFVIDVGDAVIEQVLHIKDFIYLYSPILLFLTHMKLNKKDYYFLVTKIGKGKKTMIMTLMTAGVLIAIFIFSLTSIEVSRLHKQWNREYVVSKFGLYTYQANDIFQSLEPKVSGLFGYDNAVKIFREFYKEKEDSIKKNKYSDIFVDKNVIVIHAESMQTIAMDLKFNGQEVTPVLNKLAREGMFFSNFYSPVSVGTSSDAEFMFNTGLLPVSSGTVFISYSDREFVTTANLLKEKNYYTFVMHGNNAGFWNRNIMYRQIGYDRFYSKNDYEIDEVLGLGISDRSFYRQSVEKIEELSNTLEENQRFLGKLITLTNHTPWNEIEAYGDFPVTMKINVDGQEIETPYMESTTFGKYIKASHYADQTIGEFINGLDEKGLLDNTVVLIYGDHDARIRRRDYDRLVNYNPYTDDLYVETDEEYVEYDIYDHELDRKVPLIIWTKDKKFNLNIKTAMGMTDVLPTLGNMLGIYSPYALGVDIFNVKNNTVVFPNGNFLTNNIYYNNQKEEYKLLSNEAIPEDYINKNIEYTNKVLDVSNALIKFDLIRRQRTMDILSEGDL